MGGGGGGGGGEGDENRLFRVLDKVAENHFERTKIH